VAAKKLTIPPSQPSAKRDRLCVKFLGICSPIVVRQDQHGNMKIDVTSRTVVLAVVRLPMHEVANRSRFGQPPKRVNRLIIVDCYLMGYSPLALLNSTKIGE